DEHGALQVRGDRGVGHPAPVGDIAFPRGALLGLPSIDECGGFGDLVGERCDTRPRQRLPSDGAERRAERDACGAQAQRALLTSGHRRGCSPREIQRAEDVACFDGATAVLYAVQYRRNASLKCRPVRWTSPAASLSSAPLAVSPELMTFMIVSLT